MLTTEPHGTQYDYWPVMKVHFCGPSSGSELLIHRQFCLLGADAPANTAPYGYCGRPQFNLPAPVGIQ